MMGLSRGEFLARVGLLKEVDPLTDLAFRFEELQAAGQSQQGSAVETKWHLSFHGSQFPGRDPYACGRRALYQMIDIPRSTGSYFFSNRKLQHLADAGKDIENRLVERWHNAGYLLSPPPWEYQLQFEDPHHWLTSTVDALVVPPRATRPVVAEIKTKFARDIEAMKLLLRGPDEKHINQIKCQIGMAHEAGEKKVFRCFNTGRLAVKRKISGDNGNKLPIPVMCPQHLTDECLEESILEPAQYGFIYYVSRDNPIDTHEFYVEYDPEFMRIGREKLSEWKQYFIDEELPQTNFEDKRYSHPFDWTWGDSKKMKSPCKWCDFGDVCREDHRKAIEQKRTIKLHESAAVEDAKAIRPDYSYEEVRAAVLARWGFSVPDVKKPAVV